MYKFLLSCGLGDKVKFLSPNVRDSFVETVTLKFDILKNQTKQDSKQQRSLFYWLPTTEY